MWLSLLLACGTKSFDSEPPVDSEPAQTNNEPEPCGVLEIDYDGDNPPQVGDEWTVWLRCDGAVLMGAVIIQIDPVEAALIYENVLTFAQAGDAVLSMQAGHDTATMDITIEP